VSPIRNEYSSFALGEQRLTMTIRWHYKYEHILPEDESLIWHSSVSKLHSIPVTETILSHPITKGTKRPIQK